MTRTSAVLISAFLILVAARGAGAADDSLYQHLGGQDGIVKIANLTTDNFLADNRIKATFYNTNMDRFRKLLAEQLCSVSGGPCKYTGRSMAESHKGLHLHNKDFNAVVEDLERAMDAQGIPFATQNRLLAILAPMQHDIVTR